MDVAHRAARHILRSCKGPDARQETREAELSGPGKLGPAAPIPKAPPHGSPRPSAGGRPAVTDAPVFQNKPDSCFLGESH